MRAGLADLFRRRVAERETGVGRGERGVESCEQLIKGAVEECVEVACRSRSILKAQLTCHTALDEKTCGRVLLADTLQRARNAMAETRWRTRLTPSPLASAYLETSRPSCFSVFGWLLGGCWVFIESVP